MSINNIICPYDGFKFITYSKAYIHYLKVNAKKYELTGTYSLETNMPLEYPIQGTINGINIKIHLTHKGPTVTIGGSFHKYKNKNEHNYDIFYFEEFVLVYKSIIEFLKLPVKESSLSNLEIGLNIYLPPEWEIIVSELISRFIFVSRNTKSNEKSFVKHLNNGASVFLKSSSFWEKGYDKGRQNKLLIEIFRFERRYINKRIIKRLGYESISDLLKPDLIPIAGEDLIRAFKKYIIYEPSIEQSPRLMCSDKTFLLQVKDPYFLEAFSGSSKEFNHIKNKFQKLVKKHSTKNIHSSLITNMCQQLRIC